MQARRDHFSREKIVMPLAAVMTAPHKPIEIQDLPAARMEPGGLRLETIF